MNSLNKIKINCDSKFVFLGIILFVAWLCAANIQIKEIGPGLDPCYNLVGNLFYTHHIFGLDLLYNYGPLAFLGFPENINYNVVYGTFFYLLGLVLLALSLIYIVYSIHRKQSFVSLILKYIPISLLVLYNAAAAYVGYPIIFVVFNCLIIYTLNPNIIFLYLACVLMAVIALVKPAFFYICFFCLLSYLLYYSFHRKKIFIPIKPLIVMVFTYLLIWCLFVGSISSLGRYLRATFELTVGNSDAMVWGYLHNWFCFILSYGLAFSAIFFINKKYRYFFLVLFITANILWLKYVLARIDHIPGQLFPLYLYFIGMILIMLSDTKKYVLAFFLLLLSLGCFNNSIDLPLNHCLGSFQFNNIFSRKLIANINRASSNNLEKLKFDTAIINLIKNNTVDAYPWDMTAIFSNRLNWCPRPVFQSYIDYTPWLDKQNEDFYNSVLAPKFIIWQQGLPGKNRFFDSIDNRYILNDEPKTIKSIFSLYQLCYVGPKILIFHKKNIAPLLPDARLLSCQDSTWDTWVDIPGIPGKDVIRAEINVNNSFLGWLKKTIYRNSLVSIDYKLNNGKIVRRSLPIKNALSGVWISPYLINTQAFGVSPKISDTSYNQISASSCPVRSIRLATTNKIWFNPIINIRLIKEPGLLP